MLNRWTQAGLLQAALSAGTAAALFGFAHRAVNQSGDGPDLLSMIWGAWRDVLFVPRWAPMAFALLMLIVRGVWTLRFTPIALAQVGLFWFGFLNLLWEMGTRPEKFDFRILYSIVLANQMAWMSLLCAVATLAVAFGRTPRKDRASQSGSSS